MIPFLLWWADDILNPSLQQSVKEKGGKTNQTKPKQTTKKALSKSQPPVRYLRRSEIILKPTFWNIAN